MRLPLRSIHFVGVINKDDAKKSSKLRAKDADDLYLKIQFKKLDAGKGADSDAVSILTLFVIANVSYLLMPEFLLQNSDREKSRSPDKKKEKKKKDKKDSKKDKEKAAAE